MTDDTRPLWPHREISEADFRKINGAGQIISVKAKWRFTGEDTSHEWLEVTSANDKVTILPTQWPSVLTFVGYSHVPGLFKLNYLGEQCEKTQKAIDAWEKKNASDLREYERLKAKFDGRKD